MRAPLIPEMNARSQSSIPKMTKMTQLILIRKGGRNVVEAANAAARTIRQPLFGYRLCVGDALLAQRMKNLTSLRSLQRFRRAHHRAQRSTRVTGTN